MRLEAKGRHVTEEHIAGDRFLRLYQIVARLRAPDGCPWDRKQTPESLRTFLLEEVYECIEAIDEKDDEHIREELGDIFMLVTMIAFIKEQEQRFSVAGALAEVCDKLVRRHPHVFGDSQVANAEEVVTQWAEIKKNVEGRKGDADSALGKIPKGLPPLERAYQLQRRAREVGFDWSDLSGVWEKVEEEIGELKASLQGAGASHPTPSRSVEAEYGDLLFSVINLGRFLKIDPSIALLAANEKFSRRFAHVEQRMRENGIELRGENFAAMDGYWEEAKRREREAT